jgi:para-nitrobenzyl esterase
VVFRGVPYAAGPVGAERFAAPMPPPHWDGVRDASEPGPTAPAPERGRFGALDLSPVIGPGWRPGRDYLTATVWTPDPGTGGLPVLVFVHGGGFLAGSADAPVHDGSAFARDGVVQVALNYRLGVPGWLHLPGAPANRGLLDVLAGLAWVRENIAAFGGDPNNVTVAGQSAGAIITGAVLATAPRGLVRRVVSQSGSGLAGFSIEQAGATTAALAAELGVPPTVAGFADVSDERLIAGLPAIMGTTGNTHPLAAITPFSLVSGTETLPGQPSELVAAGAGEDVTLLIGTNRDEANLYLVPTGLPTTDGAAMTARIFGTGTAALADAHVSATYRYEFAWRSPAFGGQLGSAHCMELPFVFDRTELPALRGPEALLGLGAAEPSAALAEWMHRAWVRFAASGDPGWLPYGPDRHIEVLRSSEHIHTH